MSMFNGLGQKIYDFTCGTQPNYYPWHIYWLSVKDRYKDLLPVLPLVKGKLLDVGCGDKPYQKWFCNVDEYVGVDIYPGPKVDIVIDETSQWPFDDSTFDAVWCTQVFEHVKDLDHILDEIYRVLKPQGILMITVPFLYNEHGSPYDFRRFTIYGLKQLLEKYEMIELKKQGGIGSVLGILIVNWLNEWISLYKITLILKNIFMPVWILWCFIVNVLGICLDKVDSSGDFYYNVFVVGKKCD